jgi:hypothetical protein
MKTRYLIILIAILSYACNGNKSNVENITNWVNDSLNINNDSLIKSGRWIDTVNTNMAFALYQGKTNIFRFLHIKQMQKEDLVVRVINLPDGPVRIESFDSSDYNGEYFIVNQGILEMHNKEGKIFAKAIRLYEK